MVGGNGADWANGKLLPNTFDTKSTTVTLNYLLNEEEKLNALFKKMWVRSTD